MPGEMHDRGACTEPSLARSTQRGKSIGVGVTLMSWTVPRAGPLKLTEFLALLNLHNALSSARTVKRMAVCFGPFMLVTLVAAVIGIFSLGYGDNSLTSEKGLYGTPGLTMVVTTVRTLLYVLIVAALLHYFRVASNQALHRTLGWCYAMTLLPGLVQIARIYSHFYFDIPFFERPGYGPFSGVFDAGYLRLMGFDFEPLAYATSLIVVCCLRVYSHRRIPWLGLVVLAHTFSVGAVAAFAMALALAYPNRSRRVLVLMYLLGFTVVSVLLWTYQDELLETFLLLRSVSERINTWGACINIWLDHPFGIGPGLYAYFFNLYDQVGLGAPQLDFYPNNDPAMFLATGGVLYLLAYLWIFHSALTTTPSRWIRIAVMALLIQSVSSYLIFNPAAAVVLALALSARVLPRPVCRPKRSRRRLTPEVVATVDTRLTQDLPASSAPRLAGTSE